MKKKKWMIWTSVVLVPVLVLVGVRIAFKYFVVKTKVDLPVAVKVMLPTLGQMEDVLALSGSINAEEEANAYSKVPGKLARYVKVEGDRVAKDETLAWVERDEVGLTYSLSPVKSPISGLVAQKFLEIGESVSPGGGMSGTPIALVVNPSRLEVVVNVIERDVARVLVGQEARIQVEAYPNITFPGRVKRVAPVVDRLSKTTRVVIGLQPSEGRLKSGMFADVAIVLGRKNQVLMLPREAILKQNQQAYVYVSQNNRVKRCVVVTGWQQGSEIEILSGISSQDLVVVEGQTRLTENARIQISEKVE